MERTCPSIWERASHPATQRRKPYLSERVEDDDWRCANCSPIVSRRLLRPESDRDSDQCEARRDRISHVHAPLLTAVLSRSLPTAVTYLDRGSLIAIRPEALKALGQGNRMRFLDAFDASTPLGKLSKLVSLADLSLWPSEYLCRSSLAGPGRTSQVHRPLPSAANDQQPSRPSSRIVASVSP